MSRFKKLAHVLWDCQYHVVWVLKYRYRILQGEVARETGIVFIVSVASLDVRLRNKEEVLGGYNRA